MFEPVIWLAFRMGLDRLPPSSERCGGRYPEVLACEPLLPQGSTGLVGDDPRSFDASCSLVVPSVQPAGAVLFDRSSAVQVPIACLAAQLNSFRRLDLRTY